MSYNTFDQSPSYPISDNLLEKWDDVNGVLKILLDENNKTTPLEEPLNVLSRITDVLGRPLTEELTEITIDVHQGYKVVMTLSMDSSNYEGVGKNRSLEEARKIAALRLICSLSESSTFSD